MYSASFAPLRTPRLSPYIATEQYQLSSYQTTLATLNNADEYKPLRLRAIVIFPTWHSPNQEESRFFSNSLTC